MPKRAGSDPSSEMDSLDRRNYARPWRRFDRRAVAPALVGATMMMPGTANAADLSSARRPAGSGDEPERDRELDRGAIRGASLYVKPDGPALQQARAWRSARAADAQLLGYVASQATGSWFGDWNGDVARDVDRLMDDARGRLPVIVAYNIPNRDCGAHSAGGAGSASTYREWIRDLARGIGDREAIVVLEPDALGLVSCLTHEGRSERFSLIREAVSVLKARTDAHVYIDAGHANWVDDEEMAQRLHLAGIDRADGFSLNVSNFVSTERNLSYGEQLSRRLNGAHFLIDTGRNGAEVRAGEWCNPDGAALGAAPTTETGHPLADAFLWVKPPGESDGTCNGGPTAGAWWGDYALEMARRSAVA